MDKTSSTAMVYWHSEGASSTEKGLHVRSANLIDFFISLRPKLAKLTVSAPSIPLGKTLVLEGSAGVEYSEAPRISGGRIRTLVGLLGILKYLTVGEGRLLSRSSDCSVSVGLSGFGTIVGIRRIFVDKKPHAFVVRGNRLKTVSSSSRPFLSKNIALLRIHLYIWILKLAVNSGRAQVWFQGGAYMAEISHMVKPDSRSNLFGLNAVLRDLPEFSVDAIKASDLVFLGRLTVEKGLLELIESLQILKKNGRVVTLEVIGDGPDRLIIERAAQAAGVQNQVNFVGFIADKVEICKCLSESKVFVLPSYTEGLPRSMLEAASLRVPIVSTAVGGIPLVFKHAESAIFVEVGNAADLADKIGYVLDEANSVEIEKIVRAGKLIANSYSFADRGIYFLNNLNVE